MARRNLKISPAPSVWASLSVNSRVCWLSLRRGQANGFQNRDTGWREGWVNTLSQWWGGQEIQTHIWCFSLYLLPAQWGCFQVENPEASPPARRATELQRYLAFCHYDTGEMRRQFSLYHINFFEKIYSLVTIFSPILNMLKKSSKISSGNNCTVFSCPMTDKPSRMNTIQVKRNTSCTSWVQQTNGSFPNYAPKHGFSL